MSTVPNDDMLFREIVRIQDTLGPDIGLQKIYNHIKAEHPLWIFGIKRLRTIRKDNNLAPPPPYSSRDDVLRRQASSSGVTSNIPSPGNHNHTRSTTSDAQPIHGLDVLQMHLTFDVIVGQERHSFTFKKPVPHIFCVGDSDRQAAFACVTDLIGACEQEIVASNGSAWRCAYCGGSATRLYSYPFVNFNDRPPSGVSKGSLPVCGVRTKCHDLAHKAREEKMKTLKANGMMPRPKNSSEDWVTEKYYLW